MATPVRHVQYTDPLNAPIPKFDGDGGDDEGSVTAVTGGGDEEQKSVDEGPQRPQSRATQSMKSTTRPQRSRLDIGIASRLRGRGIVFELKHDEQPHERNSKQKKAAADKVLAKAVETGMAQIETMNYMKVFARHRYVTELVSVSLAVQTFADGRIRCKLQASEYNLSKSFLVGSFWRTCGQRKIIRKGFWCRIILCK